jgi:hypothetical protein
VEGTLLRILAFFVNHIPSDHMYEYCFDFAVIFEFPRSLSYGSVGDCIEMGCNGLLHRIGLRYPCDDCVESICDVRVDDGDECTVTVMSV